MRIVMLLLVLVSGVSADDPGWDGTTLTVEKNGKTQRYRLVSEPLPDPQGSKPAFDVQQVDPTIPALVTVHGLDLGLDPLTTRYEWDFGDPGSDTNRLVGFVAGHVYDKPGDYSITLRTTSSEGVVTTWTQTVRIQPDTRRVVYVSSTGSDNNDGTMQRPMKNLSIVGSRFDQNVQILLKRGETFDVTGQFLSPRHRVWIGAYGDPNLPQPVIRYVGQKSGEALIRCSDQTIGLVVEQVSFDSQEGNNPNAQFLPHCIVAGGKQIVIRDVTFLNVSYAINGNAKPRGVMIQRCKVPDTDGLRRYLAWIEGTDWVILNNQVSNSTIEHCIRGRGYNRLLVSGNDLSNIARPEFRDIAKNTINLQAGENVYVEGNTFRGPSSIGPLGKTDGLKIKSDRSRCYVLENNHFLGAPLEIQHGISEVMIRRNRFEVENGRCIIVDGFDPQYERGVSRVTMIENMGKNTGQTGGFLLVTGKVDGISLIRNTYVAPELKPGVSQTANVYVADQDLSGFRRIDSNTWSSGRPTSFAQGGVMYVWPNWSDQRGYLDPSEWSQNAKVNGDVFR